MKMIYEAPLAELINFSAREQLAVIEESQPEPELGVGSKDF